MTALPKKRDKRPHFLFSDDIADWMPKIKESRQDRRKKHDLTGQKRPTKGKAGEL